MVAKLATKDDYVTVGNSQVELFLVLLVTCLLLVGRANFAK